MASCYSDDWRQEPAGPGPNAVWPYRQADEKRYPGPRKGGASAPPRRRPNDKLLKMLGALCGGAEAPPFRTAPQHFFISLLDRYGPGNENFVLVLQRES